MAVIGHGVIGGHSQQDLAAALSQVAAQRRDLGARRQSIKLQRLPVDLTNVGDRLVRAEGVESFRQLRFVSQRVARPAGR